MNSLRYRYIINCYGNSNGTKRKGGEKEANKRANNVERKQKGPKNVKPQFLSTPKTTSARL